MKTARLLHALSMVLPAAEKKTLIAQQDHFVFYEGNVSTYNGKIFFSHPVETDINCSVSASDIIEIIKSIDSDTVELSVDKQTLEIKSKDIQASLSTEVDKDSVVQAITTMNLDKIDWDKASKIPSDLIEGIKDCQFSVSKDANDARGLHFIHIQDNVVESGDGFRCSEFVMEDKMEEVLIPSSSAEVLSKQDPEQYIIENGWIHFIDMNDVIFSIRTGEGDFPDISKIIDSVRDGIEVIELPIELKTTLSKFASLSDGTLDVYKFVNIEIKDGELSCSTHKETCKVKKTMKYEDKDVEINFFISPVFLMSIMDRTVEIGVNTESKIALFSTANFTHIITLPEE